MSDSESTPDVTAGNVEGDVNVEQPAEKAPAEENDTDDNASATDDASVDTGALQED